MLTEEPTRMDWVSARYVSEVSITASSADVSIRIDSAPELLSLVEAGLVSWVAEVRCPPTLYAETYHLAEPTGRVEFGSEDIEIDKLFVRTGLVALEDLQLPTSGLHQEIWGSNNLFVPAGTLLAAGAWHASKTLAQSLLVFEKDGCVDDGAMGPVRQSGDQFVIPLGANLFDHGRNHNTWMGALVAVFAYLGKHPPEEEDESVVLTSIRNMLQDANVPDWHEEEYDAAKAATVLEKFEVQEDVDGG